MHITSTSACEAQRLPTACDPRVRVRSFATTHAGDDRILHGQPREFPRRHIATYGHRVPRRPRRLSLIDTLRQHPRHTRLLRAAVPAAAPPHPHPPRVLSRGQSRQRDVYAPSQLNPAPPTATSVHVRTSACTCKMRARAGTAERADGASSTLPPCLSIGDGAILHQDIVDAENANGDVCGIGAVGGAPSHAQPSAICAPHSLLTPHAPCRCVRTRRTHTPTRCAHAHTLRTFACVVWCLERPNSLSDKLTVWCLGHSRDLRHLTMLCYVMLCYVRRLAPPDDVATSVAACAPGPLDARHGGDRSLRVPMPHSPSP
jgi:hypothetical protein